MALFGSRGLNAFFRCELKRPMISGFRGQIETSTVEVDRVDEILFVPEPRAVYFTHWILALIDSLRIRDAVAQIRDDVLEPPRASAPPRSSAAAVSSRPSRATIGSASGPAVRRRNCIATSPSPSAPRPARSSARCSSVRQTACGPQLRTTLALQPSHSPGSDSFAPSERPSRPPRDRSPVPLCGVPTPASPPAPGCHVMTFTPWSRHSLRGGSACRIV